MKLAAERRSAMVKRLLIILAALALCVALVLGCGGDQPATQQPASLQTSPPRAPAPTEAPTPRAIPSVSAQTATGEAASPTALLVPTPTPPPSQLYSMPPQYPPGVPSLDELIVNADVVAWVHPPTVTGKSKTISSEDGVAPTYRPFVEFEFEVVEYLKGSGESALTVESTRRRQNCRTELLGGKPEKPQPSTQRQAREPDHCGILERHTYLTDTEALSIATDTMANEYDDRGRREGVVFLQFMDGADGSSSQIYRFLNLSPADDSEKAWLPAIEDSSGKSAVASDGLGGSAPDFLNPEPTESFAEPNELTLDYLRSRIKAVAATLAEGEGVEGYEECVAYKFAAERRLRAREEVEGKVTNETIREGPFDSGLPAGTEISNSWFAGEGYRRPWYEGTDAELFRIDLMDEEVITPDYFATRNDAVAYFFSTKVSRPLPRGRYEVKELSMSGKTMPCNFYIPRLAQPWTFTFESPEGTLHEAFFDPAAMDGGGTGADGDDGVLKPAAFSLADGTGASLESIAWRPSAVEMRLNPHAPLPGYHADFIALDGSVSLRLDFDDATETREGGSLGLSWPVCVQRWEAGDLLMLRISESPPDLTGVNRDTGCANAPTPTPAE